MSAAEAQAGIGRTLALDPAGLSAERLNRRFGACEVAAPIENNHVSEPAYKEVGAACEYAHTLWPNANAAILFGSRARRDHRADSDWDVAFITQKDELLPGSVSRVFDLLRKRSKIDVQALAISQARLCKSADSLGKIAAPIAREGRLIAGHCEWPEIESEPILKPVDYLGWRSDALRRVASASKNLALAIDRAVQRLIATVSFAIMEAEELPGYGDLRDAAREVAGNYWKSILDEAGLMRRTLQNIDSNNLTYSTADSDLVESVSMAASFGEEIAQAMEKLADSPHAESENHA